MKTILDADLSNDVESHVYDAQDPKTSPQDSDSPQKLGDEEQQTAQTLRNAGEAQEEGDFPAKDFKEQVGERYPESGQSCKLWRVRSCMFSTRKIAKRHYNTAIVLEM